VLCKLLLLLLQFLFTIATTARGSTERHGDFLCNEYKDVYLLEFNGDISELKYAEGEVEEVKFENWQSVQNRLTSSDGTYIPRSESYITGLFNAVQQRLKAKQT
jgi:hypothetical protein